MTAGVRAVWRGCAVAGLAAALLWLGVGGAGAVTEGWTCAQGQCTADVQTPIQRLSGSFAYGAGLSPDRNVDQIAALEQQRWREFRFTATAPARIYTRMSRDPGFAPDGWPSDTAPDSPGPAVSRYVSLDGEHYDPVQDGALVPKGAYLSIIVAQDVITDDAGHITYVPARWSLDVSTRRVIDEAALPQTAAAAPPPLVADTGGFGAALQAEDGVALDAEIGAALPCAGAECRPPDLEPSATYDDGTPVQGDPVGQAAATAPPAADPAVIPDPGPSGCGADMLECAPPDMQQQPEDPRAPGPASASDPLATELQTELARVGCYTGRIDGLWGPASRRAMRNFNHWAGKTATVNTPSPKALVIVARTPAPVCGTD